MAPRSSTRASARDGGLREGARGVAGARQHQHRGEHDGAARDLDRAQPLAEPRMASATVTTGSTVETMAAVAGPTRVAGRS